MHYLGIDVAKHTHVGAMLGELDGGRKVKTLSFGNDEAGFARLWKAVQEAGADDVVAGMESTGSYWLPLCTYLRARGVKVKVFNPLTTSAMRRALGMDAKTDRVDSVLIARMLRYGDLGGSCHEDGPYARLKRLCRMRQELSDEIGRCKVAVLTLLDSTFPEYRGLWSDMFCASSRAVLDFSCDPATLATVSVRRLEGMLDKASRGRCPKDKASRIHEAASSSVGVDLFRDVDQMAVRHYLQRIDMSQRELASWDAMVTDMYDSFGCTVHTIDGMSKVRAACILAEVGDVSQFPRPGNLVSFAGIDPKVSQSGQSKACGMHISKKGSAYLRHSLHLASLSMLGHNQALADFYHYLVDDRGKDHGVALVAMQRKILNICFRLMNDGSVYHMEPFVKPQDRTGRSSPS